MFNLRAEDLSDGFKKESGEAVLDGLLLTVNMLLSIYQMFLFYYHPIITYTFKILFGRVWWMPVYYQELLQTKPVFWATVFFSHPLPYPFYIVNRWENCGVMRLCASSPGILRDQEMHLGIGEGVKEWEEDGVSVLSLWVHRFKISTVQQFLGAFPGPDAGVFLVPKSTGVRVGFERMTEIRVFKVYFIRLLECRHAFCRSGEQV